MLKTLMQKILVGLSKNFTVSISSLLKLNFCFWHNLYTIVFRADMVRIEKMLILHIVALMLGLTKWKLLSNPNVNPQKGIAY